MNLYKRKSKLPSNPNKSIQLISNDEESNTSQSNYSKNIQNDKSLY